LPEEDDQQPNEVSIADLDKMEVVTWLGVLAAMSLQKAGVVTFFVDDAGTVQLANPLGVFLDIRRMQAPTKPFRFVRPILMNNRPQYVAIKNDGTLWEIEYIEEHEGEPT
jgi:hypothetical protein